MSFWEAVMPSKIWDVLNPHMLESSKKALEDLWSLKNQNPEVFFKIIEYIQTNKELVKEGLADLSKVSVEDFEKIFAMAQADLQTGSVLSPSTKETIEQVLKFGGGASIAIVEALAVIVALISPPMGAAIALAGIIAGLEVLGIDFILHFL